MNPRSTDEVTCGPFPAHGRATFTLDGRILVTDAEGPFNAELVAALRQPVLLASEPLRGQGRPWGQLSRFRRSAMASPEALAAFTRLLTEMRAEGTAPPFTAYVMTDEVEGARLMLPLLRRCFEAAGLGFAHFAQEDEARAWLLAQLD
ncbi:MAG: hypothetical protein J0L58_16465 [Burkholderiales bacterium]|uniref:hypothetical protein n=1 Tax=Inhella sp. TaxID=1921806 RepID=UPI001AC7E577|nr:hypothetical protein [Burkholderiales bacterium]